MIKTSLNFVIGNKLRKLRNSQRFSQQFVAHCLDISRNAYIDWERGKINFTLVQIQGICELYNIEFSEILNELSYHLPPPASQKLYLKVKFSSVFL